MFDPTSYMPVVLQRTGPLDILWWQWIALPVLIVASFVVGHLLGKLTRWILCKVALQTEATWDDAMLLALAKPLRWVWSALMFRAASKFMGFAASVQHAIASIVSALLFLCFFWFVVNMLDELATLIGGSQWAREKPVARSLVPLGVRVGKAVVVIIALISMLSELGYPVAGLIAGLGIGGIALALAAQKTVENLFGAFSIGLDQPFREGDAVKIGEFTGAIESIGLRSTRIRTGDRSVVTIPNAQVAESKIESFAERDRLRMFFKIGLVYETSIASLKKVLDEFRTVLKDEPKISDDGIDVRFVQFGASALELEVGAWFVNTDNEAFRATREKILMIFMEVVEKHQSAFAYPTQTVHVKPGPVNAQA
jgi:MscS family membrane protein